MTNTKKQTNSQQRRKPKSPVRYNRAGIRQEGERKPQLRRMPGEKVD